MVWIGKQREYKGYTLKFWRDTWGYVEVEIRKDDQYIERYENYDRYDKTVNLAYKSVKKYLDTNPFYKTEKGWIEKRKGESK